MRRSLISQLVFFFLVAQFKAAFALDVTLPTTNITVLPTDEVTVIGWIDGDAITLPTDANPLLPGALGRRDSCTVLLASWAAGVPLLISSEEDVRYANAFLIKHSPNARPPAQINPEKERDDGDFRLFSRVQVAYEVSQSKVQGTPTFLIKESIAGGTPDPCRVLPVNVPSESHPDNGQSGITQDQRGVFLIGSGRLGSAGQAASMTLNGRTVPWIWSVIRFDANGQLNISSSLSSGKAPRQIFPAFSIYVNRNLVHSVPQGDLETFIALDESSQVTRSDP